MKDMKSMIQQRYLCEQRDKEFLELYHPTLDAMMEQGLPLSKARRAAVSAGPAISSGSRARAFPWPRRCPGGCGGR